MYSIEQNSYADLFSLQKGNTKRFTNVYDDVDQGGELLCLLAYLFSSSEAIHDA